MPMIRRVLSAVVMLSLTLATAHATPPDSFAPIVDPLLPAVVNISTTQKIVQQAGPAFNLDALPNTPQNEQFKQLFKQFNLQQMGVPQGPREVTSLGSGFVIDESGYVVTNNHVVGNADAITVIFSDNMHLPATIVGRDAKTDLALLKVKADHPLTALKFGDSDTMKVGDWVIAIGNPFGLGGSVSAGIVSARGRNINAGPFDDFIQTDAAINRGNSGGPLLNTRGEVIGINSAIFSPTGGNIGIGFAVPSSMAKTVVDQLHKDGTIHRGWLGVKIETVSDELANSLGLGKARGALLTEITKSGPADAAHLQAGDVVLKFDGHAIDEMRKLPRYVADTKIGKKVEISYWRKGREATTTVTVGEIPADLANAENAEESGSKNDAKKVDPAPSPAVLGMKLLPLTKTIRAQLNIAADTKGLLVDALDENGEAAKRGIRPGDVITEVNESPVDSAEAVQRALAGARKSGKDFALVRVVRSKETLFATVAVK